MSEIPTYPYESEDLARPYDRGFKDGWEAAERDELAGKRAFEEAFNTLWRASSELVKTNENLTATQERCNTLIEKNRALRKMIKRLNDAFVASEPDKAKIRREALALAEEQP